MVKEFLFDGAHCSLDDVFVDVKVQFSEAEYISIDGFGSLAYGGPRAAVFVPLDSVDVLEI
jgi:hypothetical protein